MSTPNDAGGLVEPEGVNAGDAEAARAEEPGGALDAAEQEPGTGEQGSAGSVPDGGAGSGRQAGGPAHPGGDDLSGPRDPAVDPAQDLLGAMDDDASSGEENAADEG